MNIEIRTASETTKRPYGTSGNNSSLFLGSVIYNNLKSPMKNLNQANCIESTGAYSQFICDMEELQKVILEGDETIDLPASIELVDKYLGSLGLDKVVYPIKKDIIFINKFLNADYTTYEEGA